MLTSIPSPGLNLFHSATNKPSFLLIPLIPHSSSRFFLFPTLLIHHLSDANMRSVAAAFVNAFGCDVGFTYGFSISTHTEHSVHVCCFSPHTLTTFHIPHFIARSLRWGFRLRLWAGFLSFLLLPIPNFTLFFFSFLISCRSVDARIERNNSAKRMRIKRKQYRLVLRSLQVMPSQQKPPKECLALLSPIGTANTSKANPSF